MTPRIETIKQKRVIGKSIIMSFSENKTFQLWNSFMPLRKDITNTISNNLYSIEEYDTKFFENFSLDKAFTKWAAVEVEVDYPLPEGMKELIIPDGLYAVFTHHGPANEAEKTYNYIFREWLPKSDYALDNRPHFAEMGKKYNANSLESEEEIFIPIINK